MYRALLRGRLEIISPTQALGNKIAPTHGICKLMFVCWFQMDPDGVYEFPLVAAAAACGIDPMALTGGVWSEIFSTFTAFAQQYAQLTQRWYGRPHGYAQAETRNAGLRV
jgi:hypothetical protein